MRGKMLSWISGISSWFISLLVFLLLLFFIHKLFNFRKTRGGIAIGVVTKIMIITITMIVTLNFNWPHLISNWLAVQLDIPGFQVAENPLTYPWVIFSGFIGVSAILIFGLRAIQNFEGEYFQSDEHAQLDPENVGPEFFVKLLKAKTDLFLKSTPDLPIKYRGNNPYKVAPPDPEPKWKELSIDLISAENSDIVTENAQWSDQYKLWILEKVDHIRGKVSQLYLQPSTDYDFDANKAETAARKLWEEISVVRDDQEFELVILYNPLSEEKFDKEIDTTGNPIRVVTKVSMVKNSMDFSEYCKELVRRYSIDKRVHIIDDNNKKTNLSLNDTFVPAYVTELREIKQDASTTKSVLFTNIMENWLAADDKSQLALLGEFGQGKSSAVLNWTAEWAIAWLKGKVDLDTSRVPLLIELRGRSPKSSNSPEELLGEWGGKFGFSGRELYNLVKCGKALLIFEGFDEVKNAGQKLERYQHFNALWRLAFHGSKILFTGRPNFFLGTEETHSILRTEVSRRGTNLPYTKVYNLSFMGLEEIEIAMREWPTRIRKSLIDTVKSDSNLMNIAQRPSMLPVIASAWSSILNNSSIGKEISSASIINTYIESSFLRKEDDLKSNPYQVLPWKARLFLTKVVALKMLITGGRNTIRSGEIFSAIEDVFEKLDRVFMGEDGSEDLATPWRLFKESYYAEIKQGSSVRDKLLSISQDVRSNGILAPDPASGGDSFYFPHKQFYEYILATIYIQLISAPKSAQSIAYESIGRVPSFIEAAALENMLIVQFASLLPLDYYEKKEFSLILPKRTSLSSLALETICLSLYSRNKAPSNRLFKLIGFSNDLSIERNWIYEDNKPLITHKDSGTPFGLESDKNEEPKNNEPSLTVLGIIFAPFQILDGMIMSTLKLRSSSTSNIMTVKLLCAYAICRLRLGKNEIEGFYPNKFKRTVLEHFFRMSPFSSNTYLSVETSNSSSERQT